MAAHQNKQLGFAPACLQRGCQRDRVSGVSAIGEQCHGAEHLAGRDEAHDDLRAIASGLGDADAALDQGMGTPRIAGATRAPTSARHRALRTEDPERALKKPGPEERGDRLRSSRNLIRTVRIRAAVCASANLPVDLKGRVRSAESRCGVGSYKRLGFLGAATLCRIDHG